MIRSKALKNFTKDKKPIKLVYWWKESNYTWRIAEIVENFIDFAHSKWHDFIWVFKSKYLAAKKMWQWYNNVFINDYDFDAHGIYNIIAYKLKRINVVLEKGYAIQEDRDMKALNLGIKLANRLSDDEYESRQLDRHDKVWGKLKNHPSKVASRDKRGRPATYTWEMYREGAKTPARKTQETAEFLACYERGEKQKLRDQKNLFAILTKYIAVWWD